MRIGQQANTKANTHQDFENNGIEVLEESDLILRVDCIIPTNTISVIKLAVHFTL